MALLLCDECEIKDKGDSKLEMTLKKCKTTANQLVDLMDEYTRETHQREPSLVNDVKIDASPVNKRTIFGRNALLPSQKDGIYFFGEIKKNSVVFDFNKGNKTSDYLFKFYCNYAVQR